MTIKRKFTHNVIPVLNIFFRMIKIIRLLALKAIKKFRSEGDFFNLIM
jgi:hypothetical protein